MTVRPPLFVHVDVDGLWAVRRCYGLDEDDTWRDDPVWSEGVPRFRRLFERLDMPASFFLVGHDLDLDAKKAEARLLHDAGHELGNHTDTHHIGLTALRQDLLDREVRRGRAALVAAGLPAPAGFRAPGYDIDERVLAVVRDHGHAYDASVLPTLLSPALRAADAWMARRWQPGKRQFGRLRHAFAPRRPYVPDPERLTRPLFQSGPGTLYEVPVTTLGTLGWPLTGSVLFQWGVARTLRALREHHRRRLPLLVLFHGIDLVDGRRTDILHPLPRPRLAGFSLSAREKYRLIAAFLRALREHYDPIRTDRYVRRLNDPQSE